MVGVISNLFLCQSQTLKTATASNMPSTRLILRQNAQGRKWYKNRRMTTIEVFPSVTSQRCLGTRQVVQSLKLQGFTIYQIAIKLGKTYAYVKRWYDRDIDDIRDRPRRRLNLTQRDIRRMKRDIQKPNASYRKVAKQYNVSHTTVRKITRRSVSNPNGEYPYKYEKKFRQYIQDLPKRRDFGKHFRRIRKIKKKAIWMDQKPFVLQQLPNKQNVRIHAPSLKVALQRGKRLSQDKHQTVVHIQASVSWYSKGDIYIFATEQPS